MKINLDDPAARAAAAKAIAETAGVTRNPRDTLSEWDRENFFAHDSVQLRIPLLDPVEVRTHLLMIEQVVADLRARLDKVKKGDRAPLLMVQSMIRQLNRKLNAYRNPRS